MSHHGQKNDHNSNLIDTSHINLPQELVDLTEFLASHVHESWSKEKRSNGWTFAEAIDTKQKKSPYLVPYEQLPEHIKDHDRISAMETIKLIIALGFKIVKT